MSDPDILALIDGAIEDNAVSGNAMRWTPDDGQKLGGEMPATLLEAAASLSAPSINQLRINGVDLTPYVSDVRLHRVEPEYTIIDEVHTWAWSAFADIAMTSAPRPEPVTLDSIMAAMRLLEPPPPRRSYVCHTDEYDRLKADLDERGVEVDLTGSPHVPYGQVIRYTPPDLGELPWRYEPVAPVRPMSWTRAYLNGPVGSDFRLITSGTYRPIRRRPTRAQLRAMHTAYRLKTRNRNRRTR